MTARSEGRRMTYKYGLWVPRACQTLTVLCSLCLASSIDSRNTFESTVLAVICTQSPHISVKMQLSTMLTLALAALVAAQPTVEKRQVWRSRWRWRHTSAWIISWLLAELCLQVHRIRKASGVVRLDLLLDIAGTGAIESYRLPEQLELGRGHPAF